MNINDEFLRPTRYNSNYMERLNKRENDILARRNHDLEIVNRPRLEELSDNESNIKKEVENLIKLIPNSKIEKVNKNLKCVICLNGFKIGDKDSTLPCMHIFHYSCLKNWMYEQRWCPICKSEIFK
jgi:hypothetical protein